MKVFELAKEFDCKALELIDKIKPLNLDVKNHMSALSDEQIEKIRAFIAGAESTSATPKKKKILRKKVVKKKRIIRKRKSDLEKEALEAVENAEKERLAAIEVKVQAEAEKKLAAEAALIAATKAEEEDVVVQEKEMTPEVNEVEESSSSSILKKVAQKVAAVLSPEAPVEAEAKSDEAQKVDMSSETPTTKKEEVPEKEAAPKERFSFLKVSRRSTEEPAAKLKIIEESVMPSTEEFEKELHDVDMRRGSEDDDDRVRKSAAQILKEIEKDEAAQKKKTSIGRNVHTGNQFRSKDFLRRERVYMGRGSSKRRVTPQYSASPAGVGTVDSKNKFVEFNKTMTVEELAMQMAVKAKIVAKKLGALGVDGPEHFRGFDHWNLDLETTQILCEEMGYELRDKTVYLEELIQAQSRSDDANKNTADLKPRSPIITIMGHVDHGKTSLLDLIRRARVVSKEAGGITQHIAAYTVGVEEAILNLASDEEKKKFKKEKKKKSKTKPTTSAELTFLDTPGHAAFTEMRSRGAHCTDIVVLVVAATDGLMPQTREAIDHAKAAGVPMIVAINKMDLPEANPDKVQQQLGDLGILSEEWGGETLFAKISALTGDGVSGLLEQIQLQAELLDLKANPQGRAEGVIIEAKLDKGKGPVSTALIQSGTLKVGDFIVAGLKTGKVRALIDDKGKNIKEAGPSTPVGVLGLSEVPDAGDAFHAVESEKIAKEVAEIRKIELRKDDGSLKKMSLEDLMSKMSEGEKIVLPLILKADVHGSSEAIHAALLKFPDNQVQLKVLSTAVGGISESDILLADASNAIILGFNVRPDAKALKLSEQKKVQVKTYDIIYNLLDDVKAAMEGLLSPIQEEFPLGQAEVRDVFNLSKFGVVAGSFVTSGKMKRGAQLRLLRDGKVVYTGAMSGLKRFKDDVKEVKDGYECGISFENYQDIKAGDVIEAFEIIEKPSKLEGTEGLPLSS